VRAGTRIVSVPLEDYVLGSALSEVSPVGQSAEAVDRIFELQAILARTYAAGHRGRHAREGFDLCDATHCQLYEPDRIRTSRFADAARRAVATTHGEVLLYGERPAEALYHADCGGHTAAASDVWGGASVSYLSGTPDDVAGFAHRTWQFDVPADRVRAALNADTRSRVGGRLESVSIARRDASGRASELVVRGALSHTVTGEQLRSVLNRAFGDRAIQSTRLSVKRSDGGYHFAGSGFGHGVGLCQVGAAARLGRGDSVGAVLGVYYPGVTLAKVPSRVGGGSQTSRQGLPRLLQSP
jgi:stage II sporulation protein D